MTTKEDKSHTDERADELADTVVKLIEVMSEAKLNNGEEVDTLALLLGLHLHKSVRVAGPDAPAKVLERFVGRLTHMCPNLRAFVVQK